MQLKTPTVEAAALPHLTAFMEGVLPRLAQARGETAQVGGSPLRLSFLLFLGRPARRRALLLRPCRRQLARM